MKRCAYRNCFNTGYNRDVQPGWILGKANEAVASGSP